MKASTLFVICIALFIGLAAAAGAKYVGLFDKGPKIDTSVKEEPVMILVASNDLYPDLAISPNDVRVRELTSDEKAPGGYYEKNKGKLLSPNIAAANLLIPKEKILADTPLFRGMFQDKMPDAVTLRLRPGYAAVNVSVPRERSAGGVIQLGEYVNVDLTAKVTDGDGRTSSIKTAQIAKNCGVIMKRNSIYQRQAADGDIIPFTLEADPYRAALINFAQHKGELSLTPVYNPDAAKNVRKSQAPERAMMDMPPDFNEMDSDEYRGENARVAQLLKGDLLIGDDDMTRIFKPKPAPAPKRFITTREIRGIGYIGTTAFEADGQPAQPGTSSNTPDNGGNGGSVSSTVKNDPNCPECEKKRQAEAQRKALYPEKN